MVNLELPPQLGHGWKALQIDAQKLLVTGADGFIGRHFRSVYGGVALADAGATDLRDAASVAAAVASVQPEAVLHLAAQSSVAESFKDSHQTYAVNFEGTLHLLEALKAIDFRGVFVYISSADVYGTVEEVDLPMKESLPYRPRSPYAVSKVAAEALCFQWSQQGTFRVIVARPFNQIGPGHDARFAIPDFARQIIEIRNGTRSPVLVTGDLDVSRDFTDVRDTVRALGSMLEKGINGETYNICSGKERTLRSLVERLLQLAGTTAEFQNDPLRMRPVEQRRMVGDAGKLREGLGWQPQIPFDETLNDILRDAASGERL